LFVSISQVIGCKDHLRNDLYFVEWGVKLYSNQAGTMFQAAVDDSGRILRSQRHAVSVPIPTVPDAPPPQIMYADVPPMNMQMGLADMQVWRH